MPIVSDLLHVTWMDLGALLGWCKGKRELRHTAVPLAGLWLGRRTAMGALGAEPVAVLIRRVPIRKGWGGVPVGR